MDAGLPPAGTMQLDRTPVECALAASQVWLVKLRWLAGIGVIIAAWISDHILQMGLDHYPIYAIGVAILLYNMFFYWWLKRWVPTSGASPMGTKILARSQIAADWVAMALLIHFSGGVESPILIYFLLHITMAAILLPARDTYMFAIIATLLLTGIAGLEYTQLIPHVHVKELIPVASCQNPVYVGAILFFFTSTVFISSYLATRTTKLLQIQGNEMAQLSRDLQQTYRRLQTLYESTNVVGSTLDLQEVLDHLTRSVTKVMSSKACSIRLLDNTGRRLSLASTYGLSEEYWQKGFLLVDQNPLVQEALNGKAIAVQDISQDARLQYRQEALAEGIRATLTVPLLGRDGALGIIRVYKDSVYIFTNNDIAFLTAAASHGSIAIKNALDYQSVQNLEESKRKFILTVTHELRSPVGVVRSLLRTLTEGYTGEMSEVQQDMVARALRRADFLQTLIDDLLDLATFKTGLRLERKTEPIDLGDVLHRVIERYSVPAAEKHIDFDLRFESDQPMSILSTAEELDRVFNNLVSNAIKYTPESGKVTVSVKKMDGEGQVDVSDTGIGIPEESLSNLFEEFYRAPNAKVQSKQGTGLGLVTVKDIVTRHGGSVQVNSSLDVGTTFTVILPLLDK